MTKLTIWRNGGYVVQEVKRGRCETIAMRHNPPPGEVEKLIREQRTAGAKIVDLRAQELLLGVAGCVEKKRTFSTIVREKTTLNRIKTPCT